MCSIFGLTKSEGHITEHQLELIRRGFSSIASQACSRGKDSTGVSIISASGRRMYKTLLPSNEAVSTDEWQNNVLDYITKDTISVIGHTRAATTGDITTRNAHPFRYGHIIGAHNGIISNWDELDGYKKKMEVDSEIIFSRLSRLSYKDALEELYGYYAVSFVDHRSRMLHLAKESQAPLRLSYWKNAKTLFWGSTDQILKEGLQKEGITIDTYDMPDNSILRFDTNKFSDKPFYKQEEIQPKRKYFSFNKTWNTNSYSSYNDYPYTNYLDDTCLLCDKKVKGEDLYCKKCSKKHKVQCDGCAELFLIKDLHNIDYAYGDYDMLCNKCLKEEAVKTSSFKECDWCGDEYDPSTTNDESGVCQWCQSRDNY